MGAVYRGWDLRLKIPCAIKENTASREYEQLAEALAQQFEREAIILAALHHPNLPRVTNYFSIEDNQYLVMDYVDGEDLLRRLARQGPLPEREALNWISQACEALTYLHTRPGAPVIHRDLKPANLKITSDNRLMLVDFGLSKLYDPNLSTVAGAKGWSRGFSPPEQYDGRTDARSDQYALAATLYTLLTNQIPLDALERQMGYAKLKPLREIVPSISEQVEEAVLKALSTSPADRFESVEAFRVALTKVIQRSEASPRDATVPIAPTQLIFTATLTSKSNRVYSLAKSQNIIGRRNRNTGEVPDVDLSDEADGDTVSRRHARLNWVNGNWQLQPHTERKNLLKVNGRAVSEAGLTLQPNDQIQVGAVILKFQS